MSAEAATAGDSGLDPLAQGAVAIGAATAASGIVLAVAPRLVLRILGARRAEPAPFLFRIIGMFMTVSGGALADGARMRPRSAAALRWPLVAKVGAAGFVGWGVRSKRFGKQAIALAAFDASAALLIGAIMAKSPEP